MTPSLRNKIEKEKREHAKQHGMIRTEFSGGEIAEDMEKERRLFQLQMCEVLGQCYSAVWFPRLDLVTVNFCRLGLIALRDTIILATPSVWFSPGLYLGLCIEVKERTINHT